MTYRDRRLARAERLRGWAEKREARSNAEYRKSHALVEGIPLGQPILVGHHSEGRHRRTLDRSWNALGRAVESQRMAESMTSKAGNIEAAVDAAIYNDDPDAIERLEAKLAELEAQRARYKAENTAYRKGNEAYAALMGITVEAAAGIRVTIETGYSWCRQPHPSYSLQNLGGTITRTRQRLTLLRGTPQTAPQTAQEPAGATATARAGLTITATMTTPSRPGKQPRPVWNVRGDFAKWRTTLSDLGGSWYRGVFSFWEDPTEAIEQTCSKAEGVTP